MNWATVWSKNLASWLREAKRAYQHKQQILLPWGYQTLFQFIYFLASSKSFQTDGWCELIYLYWGLIGRYQQGSSSAWCRALCIHAVKQDCGEAFHSSICWKIACNGNSGVIERSFKQLSQDTSCAGDWKLAQMSQYVKWCFKSKSWGIVLQNGKLHISSTRLFLMVWVVLCMYGRSSCNRLMRPPGSGFQGRWEGEVLCYWHPLQNLL